MHFVSGQNHTLVRLGVEKWRDDLKLKPRNADSPFAPDADIYYIEASLNQIDDPDERLSLMKIPTTLYLTDEQIDRLILTATKLIRGDKDFSV